MHHLCNPCSATHPLTPITATRNRYDQTTAYAYVCDELTIMETDQKRIVMRSTTLVIYHYFEKDHSYVANFFHFLRFGYSPSVDYVVVIAGIHTISLPQLKNLTYIFTENKNHDYGGYAYAIKKTTNISSYDFVIFVNSSVRGPFTPTYGKKHWTEYFTDLLVGDVGLTGSTINILPAHSPHSKSYKDTYGGSEPFSHVQTMAYGMPRSTLIFLVENGFFDLNHTLGKNAVIRDYEINLSQRVIANGWNLKCLLAEYNTIDYREPHAEINPTSRNGDPSFGFAYFGRTIHPFEVMFVKTNRGMFTRNYLNRLSYSAHTQTAIPTELLNNTSFVKYIKLLDAVATSTELVPFGDEPQKVKARFLPKPLRRFFEVDA